MKKYHITIYGIGSKKKEIIKSYYLLANSIKEAKEMQKILKNPKKEGKTIIENIIKKGGYSPLSTEGEQT